MTAREVEVLRLVAGGRSDDESARTLVPSVRTVEQYIANLYTRIGARSRAEATAFRRQVVEPAGDAVSASRGPRRRPRALREIRGSADDFLPSE